MTGLRPAWRRWPRPGWHRPRRQAPPPVPPPAWRPSGWPRRSAGGAGPCRAEDEPTGLVGGQGGLRPFGDPLGLVLGDGRHDVQRQAVGRGHVTTDELDARLHQARQEMDVAGEPVELGDHQGVTGRCYRNKDRQKSAIRPTMAVAATRTKRAENNRFKII